MKLKDWLAFVLLGLIWGSAFMWIKIAVDEISPFMLVALRLFFAFIFLGGYIWFQKPLLPKDLSTWLVLVVLGVINMALPFVLVSWGEVYVDSAVAAILHSTVPLFAMVLTHFVLKDDRMSGQQVLGLLIGFLGVVVLMWRDLQQGVHANLLGELAIVSAACSYAVSAVLIRAKLKDVELLVQAFIPMVAAEVIMWSVLPAFHIDFFLPKRALTWGAILWLGVVSSAFGNMLYYYLVHRIGPTRTSMMTYIFPLVGLALGAIFLGEVLRWNLLAGSALVLGGIGIVNLKTRRGEKVNPALEHGKTK